MRTIPTAGLFLSFVNANATFAHGNLRVEIIDAGSGGADETRGSGLQGLRDRAEAIGGAFTVHSERGRGTRVVAVLPATAAT